MKRVLTAVAVVLAMVAISACDPIATPIPGRTSGGLGGPPTAVALTFDDGPNPTWTPQVLDILDRYGVKATFFVVGSEVAKYPDLARAIVARGHSIASHTWSHARLTKLSQQGMVDQLVGTNNIIRDATGYIVSCARPPYGSTNDRVNNTIASLNMRPALWSIDTRDWAGRNPAIFANSAPDSVILMHDGGGNRSLTVSALPGLIEGLQARGMEMTRVCDSRPG
ncbi:MAG: polysaccharide deacetylase family protein [Microthrixaceae bacterium]